MPRARERTAVRREQIALAALTVVSAQGIHELSVGAVASRLGLVPAALYRHYPGKEAIVDAVLDLVQERLEFLVAAAQRKDRPPLDCLRALLFSHCAFIGAHPGLMPLVFGEALGHGPAETRQKVTAILESYLAGVAGMIAAGQQDHSIRNDVPPRTLAMMFMGLIQPVAIFNALYQGLPEMEQHASRCWTVFQDALTSGTKALQSGTKALQSGIPATRPQTGMPSTISPQGKNIKRKVRMTTTASVSAPGLSASLGQLVTEQPLRARAFEALGLDYCCGGKQTLQEACAQAGLDPARVLEQIQESDQAAAQSPGRDWSTAPLQDLVDNILSTHHAYLREAFPHIQELMAKVVRAHQENHPELKEVADISQNLIVELNSHMMKEEHILFPLIERLIAGETPTNFHCGSIGNPIRVMEAEHDGAGDALARLRTLTSDYTPPEDACPTFRALLSELHHLEQDLHQHIHKENNILFPRSLELEQKMSAA